MISDHASSATRGLQLGIYCCPSVNALPAWQQDFYQKCKRDAARCAHLWVTLGSRHPPAAAMRSCRRMPALPRWQCGCFSERQHPGGAKGKTPEESNKWEIKIVINKAKTYPLLSSGQLTLGSMQKEKASAKLKLNKIGFRDNLLLS